MNQGEALRFCDVQTGNLPTHTKVHVGGMSTAEQMVVLAGEVFVRTSWSSNLVLSHVYIVPLVFSSSKSPQLHHFPRLHTHPLATSLEHLESDHNLTFLLFWTFPGTYAE